MFWICQWGNTPYEEAHRLQKTLRGLRLKKEIPNLFLLTAHPPVFTLGRRGCPEDLLSTPQVIAQAGIELIQTERGGRVTYHGPGQVVGYFIADLRSLRLNIPAFVGKIEHLLIQTLKGFKIPAHQDPDYPGVWVGRKKIGAIGLHFDRGVSMHGFALNVNPQLEHYRHIIPCGILGRKVTSMEKELKCPVDLQRVEEILMKNLGKVFETKTLKVGKEDLLKNPPLPPFVKGGAWGDFKVIPFDR